MNEMLAILRPKFLLFGLALVACSRSEPAPVPEQAPLAAPVSLHSAVARPDRAELFRQRMAASSAAGTPPVDPRSQEEIEVAACSGPVDAQHPDGWRCRSEMRAPLKAKAKAKLGARLKAKRDGGV